MGSVISLPWKKGFYSIDQVLPQEGSTALETSARWLNPDYVSSSQVRTSSDQSYHSYSDTVGTTQASSASSLGNVLDNICPLGTQKQYLISLICGAILHKTRIM